MDELQKEKVEVIKQNFFKRLAAPTPAFFKKIIAIAITLGSIGGGILLLPTTGVEIPSELLKLATYMVTIGAVAAVIAKSTVDSDKVV